MAKSWRIIHKGLTKSSAKDRAQEMRGRGKSAKIDKGGHGKRPYRVKIATIHRRKGGRGLR